MPLFLAFLGESFLWGSLPILPILIQDPKLIIYIPFAVLIILMIPLINIMFIGFMLLILIYSGIYAAAAAIVGFAVLIEMLLIINGCIRLTLTSDRTKAKKVIFILLSFIPVFNVIYGIYSLIKAKKRAKMYY